MPTLVLCSGTPFVPLLLPLLVLLADCTLPELGVDECAGGVPNTFMCFTQYSPPPPFARANSQPITVQYCFGLPGGRGLPSTACNGNSWTCMPLLPPGCSRPNADWICLKCRAQYLPWSPRLVHPAMAHLRECCLCRAGEGAAAADDDAADEEEAVELTNMLDRAWKGREVSEPLERLRATAAYVCAGGNGTGRLADATLMMPGAADAALDGGGGREPASTWLSAGCLEEDGAATLAASDGQLPDSTNTLWRFFVLAGRDGGGRLGAGRAVGTSFGLSSRFCLAALTFCHSLAHSGVDMARSLLVPPAIRAHTTA